MIKTVAQRTITVTIKYLDICSLFA